METLIEKLEPVLRIAEIYLRMTPFTMTGWQRLVYLVLMFLILNKVVKWVIYIIRINKPNSNLTDAAEIDALLKSKGNFNDAQQAAATLRSNQDHLKKTKQWAELAKLFDEANSPKDTAKYYTKAKMHKETAEQHAHMGHTVKAANMMVKAGDYKTAGLIYMQQAKFAPAAKVFEQGELFALAGEAYGKAKNFPKSIECYLEYFSAQRDNPELRLKATEDCCGVLFKGNDLSKVDTGVIAPLCGKLARIININMSMRRRVSCIVKRAT